MSRKEIAQLACKVIALWLFAQALQGFTAVLMMLIAAIGETGRSGWIQFLFVAVVPVCSLIVGAILWGLSGRIASRMVSPEPDAVTSGSLDAKAWLSLAISAIGVYLAFGFIGKVAGNFLLIARDRTPWDEIWKNKDWVVVFWTDIAKLLIAIWMIFGSRGIANIIRRFRTMGIPNPPANGG